MTETQQPDMTEPQQPDTNEPQQPDAIQPQQPDAILPQQPDAIQPQQPDTTEPQQPDATEPQQSNATEPQQPNATEPQQPDMIEPQQPGATEPQHPDATEPQQPNAIEPQQPDATEPQQPDATGPQQPNAIEPQQLDATGPQQPDALEPTEEVSAQESILGTDLLDEELLWVLIERHANDILLFIKDRECSLSQEALSILLKFSESNMKIEVVDVEGISNLIADFSEALKLFTGSSPPLVFYKKKYIANHFDIVKANRFKRLDLLLEPPTCPWYHIVIVGSGPGAQSIVTEIERFGKGLKIALIDWTSPVPYDDGRVVVGLGPQGNLPRNLLWNAIRESQASEDASRMFSEEDIYSEDLSELWDDATANMYKDITSANWNFRKRLASANIEFYRGTIEFIGKDILTVTSTIENSDSSADDGEYNEIQTTNIVGMNFVICGGSLPRIVEFPGFENCVTIDKFLYEEEFPPTALIIGNTPEVFETAHLIASYGGEVTVMNRSTKWLPSYDQESIEKVIDSFKNLGVKFLKITRIVFIKEMRSGYKVRVKLESGKHYSRLYLTVIMDYTKVPISSQINIEEAGVTLDSLSHKIIVDRGFRTSNQSIWAFGSIARGHLGTPHFELLAGKRVINLILNESDSTPMPKMFPRVLLTPLEYGSVGETEKSAKLKYKAKITVYESESHLSSYGETKAVEPAFQIKIICSDHWHCSHKEKLERVIGIHFLGKNASRLITGFASSLEKGLTKREFIEQVSIKGCTELGLFQTELKLKNVSERKAIFPNSEPIKESESLQCNLPYRYSDKPLIASSSIRQTEQNNNDNIQADANQPINALPVSDLWAVETSEASTTGTASTVAFSLNLKRSSSDNSLECDVLDREPSCTTIYTYFAHASEQGERLKCKESSETDSDNNLSLIKPGPSTSNSLLEEEVSKEDNCFDGNYTFSLTDFPTDDIMVNPRAFRFLLIWQMLPIFLAHAEIYPSSPEEIFIQISGPDSTTNSISYQDAIEEIERNQNASSEESSNNGEEHLPATALRINHFIHD